MSQVDKLINTYRKKLDTCSDLERIVYLEAVVLLENNVNPDNVRHWVNTTIYTFNNKPQPLSDKEKARKLQRYQRGVKKKAEKEAKFITLTKELETLIDKYGIVAVGFFGPKEVSYSEYKFIINLIKANGLKVVDPGDGAYEPHVSKEVMGQKDINSFKTIRHELGELFYDRETMMCDVFSDDIVEFRKKIVQVIKELLYYSA